MPRAKTDREAVTRANAAFYDAFASLDIDRMAAVWARESYISCTHPGWARLVGWGPVMQSWEDIFGNTFGMKFEIVEETVQVIGDLGWVACAEHIEARGYEGVSSSVVEATNIFERRGDLWMLVHHHGSPLMRAVDPSTELQ